MKVRVGHLLASSGADVPADRVAAGVPALVYCGLGGEQEVVDGVPLLASQLEGRHPVGKRDDDSAAG
jgi:hypothetical protein